MSSDAATGVPITLAEKKGHSFFVDLFLRLVKEKPLGTFGAAIVVILLFTGIFANFLAPFAMNEVHLADRLLPPSVQYPLGTDHLGRDLLSNLIYGAQISVIIGLAATVVTTLVSLGIGVPSGLFGGKTDLVVQRFVDAFMSMPALLILLTMISIVGRGMPQVIGVIGITSGIRVSRVIRSAVIGIKENVYMDAARATGCSTTRVMVRHILPNIMAPIIVNFTIGVGAAILMESSMSFLGFGVPPGVPSWGSMLSAEGRQYMQMAPQLALYPGIALSIVVYGINMFGDAMRDLLDPRLRGGLGRYVKAKKFKKQAST